MLKKIASLSLITLLLGACSVGVENSDAQTSETQTSSQEVATQGEADISIIVEGEVVENTTVNFGEGEILFDVLNEHFDVNSDTSDFGEFITSIEGYSQDEANNLYWTYDVNGELAPVGVSEYELMDGDSVEFRLEEM